MNPVLSTPDSINDFTRRMVLCNIKKSLEPLGDEALARDQSIQKFALKVLRDWLPRCSGQGDPKSVAQLCSQIKKYFTNDPAQDKVNALASQIQVTCSSACSGRLEAWMEPFAMEQGLCASPAARLDAALKTHRSKEEQIVCCQWMMSMILHECERMHALRKVFVLQHEIERNRNRSFSEETHFTFNGTEMEVSLVFPSDQVREFDEVCFWLNFNQIQKSVDEIEKELQRSLRSNDKTGTRAGIGRFQAHVKKIRDAVAALSEYNPILKRAGEELLFHIEGKIYLAAIACLRQSDAVQPICFAPAPAFLNPMLLMDSTAKYFSLLAKGAVTPSDAANLYFAYFEQAQAFYVHCRQTRDALIGTRDPVKYNLSRIPNTSVRTLPETIELEPWVALETRAAVIKDELLGPYLRIEPSRETPLQPKKKAEKPRRPHVRELPALKFSTTEEKHRLDEEGSLSPKEEERPSVWAPVPPRPILPERSLSPLVELNYAPRVERWFSDEFRPDDFAEYDGNPSPKDVCYHAFPVEVDQYARDALEQVWLNTTTGFPDRQLLIPAEFSLPDSLPVRGVISYAIGQDGICYHRCFHPMKTLELVEKFGFQRFEKADFPALAAEKEGSGKGLGLKPNRGRKVQENPALGTVTFRDDKSGAQIQIFTG